MKQLDPDGSIQWRVEGALSDACLRWLLKNGARQLGHLLRMTGSARDGVLDELKDAADEKSGEPLINRFDHNVLTQYVRHKQSMRNWATPARDRPARDRDRRRKDGDDAEAA